MQRLWAILSLLAIAAGVALGLALAPRYEPPRESGQGRLRLRAEAFYRGLRQLDYAAAAQLMTPARQYEEAIELRGKIEMTVESFNKLSSAQQQALQKAAATVKANSLKLRVEGSWAVTSGTCLAYDQGVEVPSLLEETVWLWTAGDWWNYSMTTGEILAYGNPPDFARNVLLKQQGKPLVREMVKLDPGTVAEQAQAQAQQEQAPAPPAPPPAGGTK